MIIPLAAEAGKYGRVAESTQPGMKWLRSVRVQRYCDLPINEQLTG